LRSLGRKATTLYGDGTQDGGDDGGYEFQYLYYGVPIYFNHNVKSSLVVVMGFVKKGRHEQGAFIGELIV
jgi:hypothetical protein